MKLAVTIMVFLIAPWLLPEAQAGVAAGVKHVVKDGAHVVKFVAVTGYHAAKHVAGDVKTAAK